MKPAQGTGTGRLPHLQALRGIAASLVVFAHAADTVGRLGLIPATLREPLGHFGYLGVAIFFVISGFIIYRTSRQAFGSWAGARDFILKRFIRIFPIYWLITALFFAMSPHRHEYTAADIVCSLLLIPHWIPMEGNMHPILGQGWTLDYEMLFYGIFFLAMPTSRRIGPWAVIATLIVMVAAGSWLQPFADSAEPTTVLAYWTRQIILLFAFGIGIGVAFDRYGARIRVPVPLLWAVILLIASLGVGLLQSLVPPATQYAVGYLRWVICVLVVFICVFGRGGEGVLERWMHRFGDASYSTYLAHTFVLSVFLRLKLYHFGAWTFVLAAVVCANILGWLLYTVIETRVIAALRRRLLPAGSAA